MSASVFSLFDARARGFTDPMDAVPEVFREPVRLVVGTLLRDLMDHDFADMLYAYRELREHNEGPPPYLRRSDYDDRWVLHPFTLFVIEARCYELQLVELRSPEDAPYYSVSAEVYGFMVHDGRLVGLNEQGTFAAKDLPIEPPVLAEIWSVLVRLGAEPGTLREYLAGPHGQTPENRRLAEALD